MMADPPTSRRNRLTGKQWSVVKGILSIGYFWKNVEEEA
jgi:hypothetical protein